MSIIEMDIRDQIATLIAAARDQHRHVLSEPESKTFLRAIGVPVPDGRVVREAAEARAAAAAIGPPLVVKAVAHALTHKSAAGGVIFPVESPDAAEAACRTIAARVAARRPDIALEGFLIEAYRPAQPEWILALHNDAHFGPAIMFGLGGVLVETLRQVSFRLAPLRDEDVAALLSERPATQLLAAENRAAVADVVRRLSDLAQRPDITRELAQLEINPLVTGERGVLALDALIVLRS